MTTATRARRLVAATALAVGAIAPAAAQDGGEETPEWSGSVASYVFVHDDILSVVARADRGSLHLEGRFQYEDLDTASLWAGWTFAAGDRLQLEATPMAGVVFGGTDGLAPGLELTLAWKGLELYTEWEYLFDSASHEDDFFYAWTELAWSVRPWLRLGLAGERTRLYESEREIDRGLFAAVSREPVELVAYGFNLGDDDAFAVLGLVASW